MLKIEYGERHLEYNDIDDEYFINIFPYIRYRTMTADRGAEATWALYKSIEYIVKNKIPGDIAECGVWNGGSMILAALALIHFGDTSRRIFMYDTFTGMPKPDEVDKRWDGVPALDTWESHQQAGTMWGFGGTLNMLKEIMAITSYPEDKLVYVEGMVEDTIPETMSEQLSLLRLDTDFYKSTYHELTHLYPTLSSGGVLIIDDYGYFQGSRKATDQYIAEQNLKILLTRIDEGVRLVVKP